MPVIQIKIREIAMIKKLILFLFLACAGVGIGNKTYALSTGTTSTGVYYEKETKDPTRIVDYIPFNEFSLSTIWGTITGHMGEYVSNSAGGSSTTDGWVDGRGWKGEKVGVFELLTLSTGTASARIVGRLGSTGTGSVLYEFGSTTPFSIGFPISESMDYFRVEYNITAIGTDTFRSRLKFEDGIR